MHPVPRAVTPTAFALALSCAVASSALAQLVGVEAGGGFGTSTTAAREFVLHGYVVARHALSGRLAVGVEGLIDRNSESVCVEFYPCITVAESMPSSFPDFWVRNCTSANLARCTRTSTTLS